MHTDATPSQKLSNGRKIEEGSRRSRSRMGTKLRAKLIVPAKGEVMDCKIATLSTTGAGLEGHFSLNSHLYVLVEVAGMGTMEGVVMWFREGQAGLRFTCGLNDTLKSNATLAQWIAHAIGAGFGADDSVRSKADFAGVQFDRFDGHELRLRTCKHYPINSPFRLGRFRGTVVELTPDGIVVHGNRRRSASASNATE